MPSNVKVGIIGGSGLDDPDLLQNREEKYVDTPFGKPSDALICGKLKGVDCVLLARHGRRHDVMPGNVNYRANVHAMKTLGCTHLVVTTACGSLQEEIPPGTFVIIDQFIDRTMGRKQTFYDGAEGSPRGVCHIPMHTPFCKETRKILTEVTQELGITCAESGTVLTIEGPRFSSRAESKLWHSWDADLINMSTVPEVVLAKEAGLCYASIAMATDYDSWRDGDDAEHVNVESVLKTFRQNAEKAVRILLTAIPRIAEKDWTDILKENQATVSSSIM